MDTGIYKITNKDTGKCYVGSSIEVNKRLGNHLSNLRRGRHHNSKLQEDFDICGESSFEFSKIESCEIGEMIAREDFWIEELDSVDTGYNIMRKSANTGIKKSTKGKQTQASKKRKEMDNRQLFCDTMREFVKYKDWDNPQGVEIAFSKFNLIDSKGKCSPERLRKFSEAILWVIEDCLSLDSGIYHLSHFHYLNGRCQWELEKVEKTRYTTYTDIYNRLASAIVYELDQPLCRKYLKDLKDRDIILVED